MKDFYLNLKDHLAEVEVEEEEVVEEEVEDEAAEEEEDLEEEDEEEEDEVEEDLEEEVAVVEVVEDLKILNEKLNVYKIYTFSIKCFRTTKKFYISFYQLYNKFSFIINYYI